MKKKSTRRPFGTLVALAIIVAGGALIYSGSIEASVKTFLQRLAQRTLSSSAACQCVQTHPDAATAATIQAWLEE